MPRSRLRHVPPRLLIASLAMLAVVLPAAPPAQARGGGGSEVRVAGHCGKGATSKLRLRSKGGGIRANFEVDHNRSGRWRIALIQERRVVWRGARRTAGSSDSFEVERSLRDFAGSDHVTARAWGPGGLTCEASATLSG